MNPDLERLHAYPFEKLAALKAGVMPPGGVPHIALSIGEPKHTPPAFIIEELMTHLHGLASYPSTKGRPELRTAIANWLTRRFALPESSIDPEHHVLPVNGTREALFAFAQAVIDRRPGARVVMPNPFYQIYEGAALLAGAECHYVDTLPSNRFLPDFDSVPEKVWLGCQLLYVCSPGNPTGAVLDIAGYQRLIQLADKYDFVIASDECYSELYFDEATPPPGLLQAAASMGRTDYRRCVVFHSLSKRSNVPGMRSGFVAGDAQVLKSFLLYRTYHGCAMPPPVQAASIVAWQNEAHVRENRDLYRAKFKQVMEILEPVLPVAMPDAGFYLWAETPIDEREFARRLFVEQNVTVLPGSFLSREVAGRNPGSHRVRLALVAEPDECVEAARRIATFVQDLV